jgi:hypothetical protein
LLPFSVVFVRSRGAAKLVLRVWSLTRLGMQVGYVICRRLAAFKDWSYTSI